MAQDAQKLREILEPEQRKTAASYFQRNSRQIARSDLAKVSPGREEHEGKPQCIQQDT